MSAKDELNNALINNRAFYSLEELRNQSKDLITAQYQLNEIYQKQIDALIEQNNTNENNFKNIKNNKGWISSAIDTIRTTPEWIEYNNKKTELEQKITDLKTEYINKSKELDAKHFAKQFAPNEAVTELLYPLILQQIQTIEPLTGTYKANAQYGDENTIAQETKQQQTYELFLKNPEIINNYLAQQIPDFINLQNNNDLIKELKQQFITAYAKYIFYNINKEIIYDRQDISATHTEFLNKANTEATEHKDWVLAKLKIACKYANSENQLDTNVEWISPDLVKQWQSRAIQKFEHTAGSYMLPAAQKQQFIEQQFMLEENIARAEYYLKLSKKTAAETHQANAKLLKLQEIELSERELKQKLDTAIEQAATIYTFTETLNLTGYNVNEAKDLKEQAKLNATKAFTCIPGYNVLSDQEKQIFINKLCIYEEAKLLYAKNQSLVSRIGSRTYIYTAQEFKKITEKRESCVTDITNNIHNVFKKQSQKTIDNLIERYEINNIKDEKLKESLKTQLSNAIVNSKKELSNIPKLNKEDPNLEQVIDKIEVAKILDNIESFKDFTLDEQEKYIKSIRDRLNSIHESKNNIISIEKDNLHNTNSKSKREKQNLEDNKNKKAIEIKNLIEEITISSKASLATKLELGINEDTSWADWMNNVRDFLNHPRVQGAATGALLGGLAALAAPLATGVPGVGAAINTVTGGLGTTMGVAAGVGAGTVVGTVIPQIRYLLKPFSYLYQELKDIKNKPKSYLDRTFRAGSILTSTAGMTVGIGLLVAAAANPFSGPVIAGVVVGAIATVAVAAGTAYVAKKISQTISRYKYGIEDIDLYKPTDKAIQLLDGLDNAKKVSEYFKNQINILNKKIKETPRENTMDKIALERKLGVIKDSWSQLQQGDNSYWETLSRILYLEKKQDCHKTIDLISIDSVTRNLLDLIETPKADNPVTKEFKEPHKFIGPQRDMPSFGKHKEVMNGYNQEMKDLQEINKIIKRQPKDRL
jgi:hypothetical protein